MQYMLELLGQRFRISTPFQLDICENMRPFLRSANGEPGQFQILVRPGSPKLPGSGSIWCGLYYYEYLEDRVRLLHCQSVGSAPYAMVEFTFDGHIFVTYRKDQSHLFRSASGLLHHIGMESLMLQHSGLILHASLIETGGKGILFTAPSGTGKSTQAKLWHSHRGADILNGDRAGLRKSGGRWSAWGLPYAGTSGIYRNESATISAIVVLRQGKKNTIQRIDGTMALRYLYPELTVHQWDTNFVESVLNMLEDLLQNVPIFLLECLPDSSAVDMLEAQLRQEGLL